MLARLSQVVQDVGVVAAFLFQSVSEDGKASRFKRPGRQDAVVIGGLSERDDSRRLPGRPDGSRAEGQQIEDIEDQTPPEVPCCFLLLRTRTHRKLCMKHCPIGTQAPSLSK